MGVIIYGVKHKVKIDKSLGVTNCPNCGHQVELSLAHETNAAHLYYIPLIPLGGWKLKVCPKCGIAQKLTPQEYKDLKSN